MRHSSLLSLSHDLLSCLPSLSYHVSVSMATIATLQSESSFVRPLSSETSSEEMILDSSPPVPLSSAASSTSVMLHPHSIMPVEYDSLGLSCSTSNSSFQGTLIDEIWESCRQQLEDKVKQKEAEKAQLLLGQLAYEVEKGIACKVLDPIAGEDHFIYSVEGLELALEGTRRHYKEVLESEQKRKDATEAWENLKKIIKWSDELHRFISRLELSYDSCVNLTITDTAVRDAMKNGSSRDKNLIDKLLDIHHKLYNRYGTTENPD